MYFTHHPVLAAGTRHALEDIGNDGVGAHIELGLERSKSVVIKRRHVEHTLKT